MNSGTFKSLEEKLAWRRKKWGYMMWKLKGAPLEPDAYVTRLNEEMLKGIDESTVNDYFRQALGEDPEAANALQEETSLTGTELVHLLNFVPIGDVRGIVERVGDRREVLCTPFLPYFAKHGFSEEQIEFVNSTLDPFTPYLGLEPWDRQTERQQAGDDLVQMINHVDPADYFAYRDLGDLAKDIVGNLPDIQWAKLHKYKDLLKDAGRLGFHIAEYVMKWDELIPERIDDS